MMNSKAILVTAAAGLFLMGGASASSAQTNAQALSDQALSEFAADNNWMGTNIQKRAVQAEPSALNQFNLATGYLRTQRLNAAETHYRSVLAADRSTAMRTSEGRLTEDRLEAADRLLYIQWAKNRTGGGSGAVPADLAATNVSATVGGSGDYEVTDEQARALDRQARTSR